MFSWLLNLHKCFGHKRQKVSESDSTPPPTREHQSPPLAAHVSLPVESVLPHTSCNPSAGRPLIRPGVEDGLAAVLRHPGSQSFQPYNTLAAERAGNQNLGRPSSGKGRKRAHPEPTADDHPALLEQLGYQDAEAFTPTAQDGRQSRMQRSGVTSAKLSETPTVIIPEKTSGEEMPLRRRDTPFELRVEQQLRQAEARVPGDEGDERFGASQQAWTSVKRANPGVTRSSPRQRSSPKPLHRSAWTSDEANEMKAPESGTLRTEEVPPARIAPATFLAMEGEAVSPAFGNENADPSSASLRVSSSSLHSLPRAPPSSSGKPSLQIQLPVLTQLMASNPHTPSSPQNLRFIVDKDDSYGPPNIVGVENLHTQYREDKRLRVHDTPFEVRVERLMHKEQQYKEKYLEKEAL